MNQSYLICFDVDEVLNCKENDNEEYLKGTIPEQLLVELWEIGHKIAIVSPSPYFPKRWKGDDHWFKRNVDGFCRLQNIRDAQKHYGIKDDGTIYIDDLKGVLNMIRSQSNITCFTPEEFLDSIQSIKSNQ